MFPEGGIWQRTMAKAWAIMRKNFPNTPREVLWSEFELAYEVDGVNQLLRDYSRLKDTPAEDFEIVEFLADQKKYSPDRRHWVRKPEEMLMWNIYRYGVGIGQGKLAPFIDDERIMGKLPENASSNVARVLLDVSVTDSAQRKLKSAIEKKVDLHVPDALQAVPLAWVIIQNANRMNDDWANYLLTYGITKDIFDSRNDVANIHTSGSDIASVQNLIALHENAART